MSGNFPFRVNHPPARETSPELDPGNDIHIVYPSTPADLTLKRKSQAGEGAALMHRACTSQCNSEAGVRPYKTRRLNSSPESTPNSTKTKGRVGASLPKTRRSKVAAPTDDAPSPGQPRWRMVHPPVIKNAHSDLAVSSNSTIRPRIWTSSQRELFSVIPELSKSVNGISWLCSDTPILLIEHNVWPGDGWDGDRTEFELSMIRDFSCFTSDFLQLGQDDSDQARRRSIELAHNTPSLWVEPPIIFDSFSHLALQARHRDDGCHLDPSVGKTHCLYTATGLLDSAVDNIGERGIRYRNGWYNSADCFEPSAQDTRSASSENDIFDQKGEYSISRTGVRFHEVSSAYALSEVRSSMEQVPPSPNHAQQNAPKSGSSTSCDTGASSHSPGMGTDHDRRMLEKIPLEIKALIDSQIQSLPIVVIMARSCPLLPHPLPSEYAYTYLGLFRITNINSERIVPEERPHLPPDRVDGRVKWHFTFTWASGGEEFLPKNRLSSAPWWSPCATEKSAPIGETNTYLWRDLKPHHYSVLPLRVLDPFRSTNSDYAFPRGWHCNDCGKLNEQIYLRHRRCSHCQRDVRLGLGYCVSLDAVRNFQEAISTPLPSDIYPDKMDSSAVIWGDEMRTFWYYFGNGAVVKHIYTCNEDVLQEEPTQLFQEFQLHVELSRKFSKGSVPESYFTHVAGVSPDGNSTAVSWADSPKCVEQAREFLSHRGRYYGECEDVSINHMVTLAWVSTGSRKGVIRARSSTVTVLCLGSDVVLTIRQNTGHEGQLLKCPADNDFGDTTDSGGEDGDIEIVASSQSPRKTSAGRNNAKKRENALLVTLVHGDILMLSGDDFECSIKRTGTSILLFGSHVDV